MAGMPMKEITKLVEHLEPQGVTTTRTKKGLMLRMPNGDSTMLHFTGSDVREQQNVRARIHRAGLSWPGETGLPASITEHPPTKSHLARAQRVLLRFDGARIGSSELARLVTEADGQPFGRVSAARCLYTLGWQVEGFRRSQKWRRPAPVPVPELAPEPTELAPENGTELAPETAPEPTELAPETAPEPTELAPETAPEPTELAPETAPDKDAAAPGSWAMELEHLPNDTTIEQLWVYMAALGLEGEVRVWRHA